MEDLSCISLREPNLWQFLSQNIGYNQIFSLLDRKAHELFPKIHRYYLSHVDKKNEKPELNWLNQSLDIPLFSLRSSMPHLQQCFLWERELFFISLFFWLIVVFSTFSESLLSLYFARKSFIFRSFESFYQCLNSFPISKNSAFFSFPNRISFVRHIAIFLNKTHLWL